MKLKLKQMTVGLLVKYSHAIKMSDKERFELIQFLGLNQDQFVQLLRSNCEKWMEYSMHSSGKYSKYIDVPIFVHWWMIMHAQYDKLFWNMVKDNEWIYTMEKQDVFDIYCEFHVKWTLPPTLEEVEMMEKQFQQMQNTVRERKAMTKHEFVFNPN